MKSEIEETKQNEIDWSEYPQLVKHKLSGSVFLTLKSEENGINVFNGIQVNPRVGYKIMEISKSNMIPFTGKVTLSND